MAESEFDGSYIINIDDSAISTIERRNCRSLEGIYAKENNGTLLIRKIESNDFCDEGKKDYEPNILSVGPYHNEKLATKDMHRMKYECLDYILKLNPNKKLLDYMEAMKGMETQIRSYYGDEIRMDGNSFLKMLLLDGCFIIQTLHGVEGISDKMQDISNQETKMKTYEKDGECIVEIGTFEVYESQQNIQMKQRDAVSEDDSYHTREWYSYQFLRDILLVENQIPFFVITKIYEIAMGVNDRTSFLIESIVKFVEVKIESYPKSITSFNRPKEFHHLLHLCHMYFKPGKINCESYKKYLDHESCCWHRAEEYHKAGINFKKKEFNSESPHSLLDIGFSDGMIEIPCLTIDANTICLLRNMIAFEKTCPQFGNYVTVYVAFWSQLIRMPDDVSFLTKKGIIVHQLNSDAEIFDIFMKLREGVVFEFDGDCYLDSTYSEMEAYYRSNKHRLMTKLGSIVSKFRKELL